MAVPKTWTSTELLTNTDLNASLASTAWTAVSYTNSWVDFDAARAVQYRKVGDEVQLRGLMKSGTVGSSSFTLPSGFRPSRQEEYAVESNALFGVIRVLTDGTVTCTVGSNVYVYLSGIRFSVTA